MEENSFDDIKTVNRAGQSMSDNVEYISERQQYVIYQYKFGIKKDIEHAKEIVDSEPEYMENEELSFLEMFIQEFSKAEEQESYNLENRAYLRLYRSLLGALESRMDQERLKLTEYGDDEIAPQIQHIFYLIDSAVEKEFQKVEDNWAELLKGDSNLDRSARKVSWLMKQLIRAYKLEFDLTRGDEIEEETLINTRRKLTTEWRDTYRGHQDAVNA